MSREDLIVCDCLHVSAGELRAAFAAGAETLEAARRATGVTTGCGTCRDRVERTLLSLRWRKRLGALWPGGRG